MITAAILATMVPTFATMVANLPIAIAIFVATITTTTATVSFTLVLAGSSGKVCSHSI
jgi:hypothetical protein